MRHFVLVPSTEDNSPPWQGGTPEEQGYKVLAIPKLKRPDAKNNEYYVYSSETEFKAIEADSVVNALLTSEVAEPLKVVHAHTRIEDVIEQKKLIFVEKDTGYMTKRGFFGENKAVAVPEVVITSEVQPDAAVKPEEQAVIATDSTASPEPADSAASPDPVATPT